MQELDDYRTDWWALALMRARSGGPPPLPAAAVKPRSTEEVSSVLRWAAGRGVPVVTRGGGSGVCGAAQPDSNSLVLDMTEMSRTLQVDADSQVATFEAGISGPALEAVLEASGMTLGHIPQSLHLSTLGGWIATKATGQLSTRYGGIEDLVIGMTVVAADGTIYVSKPTPRRSAGPEWSALMFGSEGTLGVVTEATVSASAIPAHQVWLTVACDDFASGLDLLKRVAHAGLRPAVARLYDETDARATFGAVGISQPTIILRFEGEPEVAEAEKQVAARLASSSGLSVTGDEAAHHWWKHRFDAAATYRKILGGEGILGPHGVVDTIEVASLWRDLGALYSAMREALANHTGMVLCHASHLYRSGANLYFTFMINDANDDHDAIGRYHSAWEAAMQACVGAKGTISHHHGVGLLKNRWMGDEHGEATMLLRRLKAAYDPSGSMNPGKLEL